LYNTGSNVKQALSNSVIELEKKPITGTKTQDKFWLIALKWLLQSIKVGQLKALNNITSYMFKMKKKKILNLV